VSGYGDETGGHTNRKDFPIMRPFSALYAQLSARERLHFINTFLVHCNTKFPRPNVDRFMLSVNQKSAPKYHMVG